MLNSKGEVINITLHQFSSSHYNEKARWALDYKGIEHLRESYLPGPHMHSIKKLTNKGVSTTPLLQAEDIVQGSAAIIDYLEQHYPEQKLYPEHVDEALNWQRRLDAELGPAVRTVVFAVLLEEPGHLCQTFAGNKPLLKQLTYRTMLPLLLPIIKKANGADSQEDIKRAQEVTDQYLNEIANAVAKTGYLVGDGFTVTDLTAAALLAPTSNVDHPDMKRPQPVTQTLVSLLAAYAEHPAISWVKIMYAKHRNSSSN